MLPDQNKGHKHTWFAYVLLSVGLFATTFATVYMKMDIEADAKREFEFASRQIELRIDARMATHAQILISAAALFDASDEVTREEWRAYTWRQKIELHLPGIQGIGFSLMIPRDQLQKHIQKIRSQGFPDYNVKPEGDRETYTSIIYLEPFSGRNLRAFGYDMFSEPVRRTAMERSMDLDAPVLSGKVILVQETDQEIQAGALMYVPVYRKGMAIDTAAHRRAALYGWAYSPYRMNDLMQGVLRGWDLEARKRIRLQIFDNERLSTDSLLYDSQPKGEIKPTDTPRLTLHSSMDFNDHVWYLLFTQIDEHLDYRHVYHILFGGIIISLLVFGLFISVLNTRFRARQLADQLTVDLRESEEKFRVIFNNEIYAICIFDLETLRLLDVNGAFSRLYGYSIEELVSGMTIHDITAEHQVSDASIRQAIHEGTVFIPLRYHRKKDGTVFPVEIVGGAYVWKGKKVMFGLAHDITDRKAADDKLFKIMREQQIILDTANVGISMIADRKQVWVNQKTLDMFKYSKEEVEGKTTRKLYPSQEEYEQQGKVAYPVLAQGHTYEMEQKLIRRDGIPIWVRCNGKAIDPSDMSMGTIWLFEDITDRKQLEQERRQLQKAESLGRMAGAIAHHFNNQLYVVTGNLEMALEALPRGVPLGENLTEAIDAARKAAEVSGLMLTYLGQTTAKQEPMDISEVCGRSMPLLRATLPETIYLETELPSPGPAVNANVSQIQQILTNLISNAGESSEGGGSIHFTVKTVSTESIPGTHRHPIDWQPKETAYACLEVKDSGCGIAEKDIEKIFDPFFTTKFPGRGLGLAVVLGIVKAHKGAITVESEPGLGSVFRVFLPVSVEAVPRLPEKSAKASEVEAGSTILLVDDEAHVRKMSRMLLRRLGFTVLEAKDGLDAVAVFRHHMDEINCVLCDLTMPRMNGWETLMALRNLSPGLSVILASGHDEAQVMSGDHPVRPDAFLHKPFSKKELAEVIQRIFAEK